MSGNSTRSKKGFVAVWLRHAPAPLLWIHPIAKKNVLMPNGDSNVLFCFRGIASVGTRPPLAMNFKICFFDSLKLPAKSGQSGNHFWGFLLPKRYSVPFFRRWMLLRCSQMTMLPMNAAHTVTNTSVAVLAPCHAQ